MAGRLLGLELELVPIERADGRLHAVDDAWFADLAVRRGGATIKHLGGRAIDCVGPRARTGVDNGFALLESAFHPLADGPQALATLARRITEELAEIEATLSARDAALLSLAQHPDSPIDQAAWERLHAPRPLYAAWTVDRGWNHALGFDSKAQNGPTTSVDPGEAAGVLDMLFRAGPALIALFANSPLEGGRSSGLKETRLSLWPRMTAGSRAPADRQRIGLPPHPMGDLSALFSWIFAPDTVMHPLALGEGGYKGGAGVEAEAGQAADGLVVVAGSPALPAFLAGTDWAAHPVGPAGADRARLVRVRPSLAHLEALQWSHFLDFRPRFALKRPLPPPAVFLEALGRPGGVEAFFADHAAALYIENRVAGTALPDMVLATWADPAVLDSCVIAPSAVQTGLVRNWRAARLALQTGWSWAETQDLRHRAQTAALADPGVVALAARVLDLAAQGLDETEHWALAYPRAMLARRESGADRVLATFAARGTPGVVASHRLLPGWATAARRSGSEPTIAAVPASVSPAPAPPCSTPGVAGAGVVTG